MKRLIAIFVLTAVSLLCGQTLTITQGDTVIIRAEQITELKDDRMIPESDIILYTLRAVSSDGSVEFIGGINRTSMNYPVDNVVRIEVSAMVINKIGTHKIQGFTDRLVPGQAGEFRNEIAELTLIVNKKIDNTPTKKWVIEFILQ